ncbi:MAG: A/G-specific adenine glycosylase [Acidobacteria bacterium]|nr:A/G-specific adenine glycosylase [Acidobacteriota bacterium]
MATGAPLARELAAWYAANARDLPWRRRVSPYRVLVSEIMLQQTMVETAAPYFERFVRAFPDVATLAAAGIDEILELWSGLGYYRRARLLHEAARALVRDHGGRVPEDEATLRSLPGIGPYTASAIRAIAHRRPAIALDGNLRRVLARVVALEGDVRGAGAGRVLTARGLELLASGDPSAFNQALMDLGATICTPREPGCPRCPIRNACRARALGLTGSIPPVAPRPRSIAVTLAAAVLTDGPHVLLRRRGGRLMAGMWEFPAWRVASRAAAVARLSREAGAAGRLQGDLRHVATLRHTITRHRITLEVFQGVVKAAPAPGRRPARAAARQGSGADLSGERDSGPPRWFSPARARALPLTGMAKKILRSTAPL